jgi:hypothetical protein
MIFKYIALVQEEQHQTGNAINLINKDKHSTGEQSLSYLLAKSWEGVCTIWNMAEID